MIKLNIFHYEQNKNATYFSNHYKSIFKNVLNEKRKEEYENMLTETFRQMYLIIVASQRHQLCVWLQ